MIWRFYEWQLTAEPELAAANIQGTLGRGVILRRPVARITLGLVVAVARAIPRSAESSTRSADETSGSLC